LRSVTHLSSFIVLIYVLVLFIKIHNIHFMSLLIESRRTLSYVSGLQQQGWLLLLPGLDFTS
jgi:hypothetical protein